MTAGNNSDHKIVWQRCLDFIKDNVPTPVFEQWFKPLKSKSLNNGMLKLILPAYTYFEWLESNAIKLLKTAIKKELGPDGKLSYDIVISEQPQGGYERKKGPLMVTLPSSPPPVTKNPPQKAINPYTEPGKIPNPDIIPGLQTLRVPSNLNESLNFSNFISGKCNQFACVAGKAIANKPGTTPYNPFLVYSATGLGKTHLAHAIGLEIKSKYPDKVVLYVSSDMFFQQFIEATRSNNRNDFLYFYQNVDVLIIDDIQFLSGNKSATQESFFQIFNHLQQSKKQIIITADKAPADITGFEARILARLKWGLVAELEAPDFDTRVAILNKKLENNGVEFPKDVVEYIALRVTANVRELEGAMLTILAQSTMNRREITIDLAKEMIDKYVKSTAKEISIEYIQKMVSEYFNIPVESINANTRRREVSLPRQICMYFAKKYTKLPLSTIGQHCGKKNHATVIYADRAITDLYETDKEVKKAVDEIDKKMKL